ncbi:MAG: hypothetical protein V1898_03745 [Patescibacteria group bacterium]
MNKQCNKCNQDFEITGADVEFYKRMDVLEPALCPDCRLQLRLSFRNERALYADECDLCKKKIISLYSPDKNYKVYCSECWWSDKYNPLEYGMDYDPDKSFLKQCHELNKKTPKPAVVNTKSENCDFTNYACENKNCYLSFGCLGDENAHYCYRTFYSKEVLDCYDLYKGELSYECIECKNLFVCQYCRGCHDSNNLILCEFCKGCSDCFGCVNLMNKNYCIYNKQYTEADYKNKLSKLLNNFAQAKQEFSNFRLQHPHRYAFIINSENSTGDQIFGCKDCCNCFVFKESDNCSNSIFGSGNKECYDVNHCDNCQMHYNSANLEKNYTVVCGNLVWYCENAYYSSNSFNTKNILGCSDVKKGCDFSILNKKYSEVEYHKLFSEIKKQMLQAGEWGEYFPAHMSPFGYNETQSCDIFTLNKEEATAKGFNWSDYEALIAQVTASEEIKICSITKKPFKLMKSELEFYKKLNIALPTKCPEQRHRERFQLANKRKMYIRKCDKCQALIQTPYSPEDKEIVYCDKCYRDEVY